MKDRLKTGVTGAANYAKARPHETKWSAIGVGAGAVLGMMVGGVGIAAMGGAVGVPAFLILAVVGGLIGNRYGTEIDRRRS